jgi:hypothetical protein
VGLYTIWRVVALSDAKELKAMKNIHLNPGGVIGAVFLLAVVIVAAIVISGPHNIGGLIGGFGVFAVFLGAAGGNYVWDRLFPGGK